jgi:hypothetical protein
MILSPPNDLTVNALYGLLLAEYRSQFSVSLSPEDDPKFWNVTFVGGYLSQLDFDEFPHHPRRMNTHINDCSDPTGRNSLKISQEIFHNIYTRCSVAVFKKGGNEYFKMLSYLDIIILDISLDTNDNPP